MFVSLLHLLFLVPLRIVPPLVSALDFSSKGELIRTHAFRAIGNICFDCNVARKAVNVVGGLEKLVALMKLFQKDVGIGLTGKFGPIIQKFLFQKLIFAAYAKNHVFRCIHAFL